MTDEVLRIWPNAGRTMDGFIKGRIERLADGALVGFDRCQVDESMFDDDYVIEYRKGDRIDLKWIPDEVREDLIVDIDTPHA